MNPQIRFGEDLMSRVSYAMLHAGGAREMTQAVREALGELFTGARSRRLGSSADDVLELVLVGNPVMHHLVLGIDPVPLGGAPFALATDAAVDAPLRSWSWARTPARASTSCPASRATWAPTPRA